VSGSSRGPGQSIPRKEDGRLVQGEGSFIDDLGLHGQGYAWFVRSPYAHARIVSVDTSAAVALEGVYAVLTGEGEGDVRGSLLPDCPRRRRSDRGVALAVDKVRYQGDAVAVVLADSRDTARDAAELVEVEYEPLAVVVDGVEAVEHAAPVLHEKAGTNVAWHGVYDYGDIDFALEHADHVVKIDRLHFHRFSSTPLECNGAVVDWTRKWRHRREVEHPDADVPAMVIGPSLASQSTSFHFRSRDIGGPREQDRLLPPDRRARAAVEEGGRPAKWTEYRTSTCCHQRTATSEPSSTSRSR